MPRRSKLTKHVEKKICGHIRDGNYASTASVRSGISERTFWGWKKRGEEAEKAEEAGDLATEDEPYLHFLRALREAEAEAETKLLALAQACATKRSDAKSVLEILERRFSKRWGKMDRHSVDLDQPITVTVQTTGAVDEGTTG